MSNAFKCDFTGELVEGAGRPNFEVAITKNLKLTIIPHVRISEHQFANGTFSDKAVEKIKSALARIAAQPKP